MASSPTQSYNLSVSNFIYVVLVAIGIFGLFFMRHGIPDNEEAIVAFGGVSGKFFGFLIWPVLFGWFFWRFCGRSKLIGSLTFNLVLTLIVLGAFYKRSGGNRDRERMKMIQEVQLEQDLAKRAMALAKNQEEADRAAAHYQRATESGMAKMKASSTGVEKKIFQLMEAFQGETMALVGLWGESLEVVRSGRILDASRLDQAGELTFQLEAVEKFVIYSHFYHDRIENMASIMEPRLQALGTDHKVVRDAIAGLRQASSRQKPFLEVLRHHIAYGNHLKAALEFLEQRRVEWSIEDGRLVFKNDASLARYRSLVEAVDQEEATIAAMARAEKTPIGANP